MRRSQLSQELPTWVGCSSSAPQLINQRHWTSTATSTWTQQLIDSEHFLDTLSFDLLAHCFASYSEYGIIWHRFASQGRPGAPGEMCRSHECQERSFRGGDFYRLNRQNIRKNNFNTSNFHEFLRECKHCSHIMPYHHIHMPHMYHSTGSWFWHYSRWSGYSMGLALIFWELFVTFTGAKRRVRADWQGKGLSWTVSKCEPFAIL